MNVLHLSAECAPLVKVGGLADVVGALPKALAKHGVEASVMIPRYGGLAVRKAERVFEGEVELSGERRPFTVDRTMAYGYPLFLVGNDHYFGVPDVYEPKGGWERAYPYAPDRFYFFQLAALTWMADLARQGRGFDLVHVHDNHVALVPPLLARSERWAALRGTPTVFTIHNAQHQGVDGEHAWGRLGEDPARYADLSWNHDLNAMRAALATAGASTTVSPSYAAELATREDVGAGLQPAFAEAREAGRFGGILNGIDERTWNPEEDPYLPATFDADELKGKGACKSDVCAEFGLDPSRPLAVFVGRLMHEKGADLLPAGIEALVEARDARVAVLGTGLQRYEDEIQALTDRLNPPPTKDFGGVPVRRVAFIRRFDEALAHRLYAAGDLFLMPSLVEPCGLGQLYAMRYGTVPVVRATGGLRDTVSPFDAETGEGRGFRFEPYEPDAFAEAALVAVDAINEKAQRDRLRHNGMTADFSWERSASEYAALYHAVSES
jgi:starch synthase